MSGWRRRKPTAGPDPAALVAALDRRELADLPTCRRVWEQGGDPLALAEAVRLSDLPAWLTDALLTTIVDAAERRPLLPALWRRRRTAAIDGTRASAVASARSFLPKVPDATWDACYRLADLRTRQVYGDMPSVSSAAIKASYRKVVAALAAGDATSFYRGRRGLGRRIRVAQLRTLRRARKWVSTAAPK